MSRPARLRHALDPTGSSSRRATRSTNASRWACSWWAPGRPASPARSASGSCSRSTPTSPSDWATFRSRSSRRASRPGSHLLSGAVIRPGALRAALRGPRRPRRHAHVRRGRQGAGVRPHPRPRPADPDAAADAQPRQCRRLPLAARSLARRTTPRPRARCSSPRRRRSNLLVERGRRGRRAHRRQGPRPARRGAAQLRARQ